MTTDANQMWLTIIFAVVIAIIVEVIKSVDKDEVLTAKQIELITLGLGILLGLGALYMTNMELSEAMIIGVGGTLISTRVYEFSKNWLGGYDNE